MAARPTFVKVSSVDPSAPESWQGKINLTFDIDWAHDDVVCAIADRVESADIAATWFVTHASPVVDRLRSNPQFELGIHPNFLPLLFHGDTSKGASAEEVLDRLLDVVPDAKSVRAHSLVESGRLLELYRDRGLTHECSAFIPGNSAMPLKPWRDWFDIVRVPYGWEDDFWFTHASDDHPRPVPTDALTGYDFHPIHAFLNTDVPATYENARPCFQTPDALLHLRNTAGRGVADCLTMVLESVT